MVMPEEMLRKRRQQDLLQKQQMQGSSTNAFEETLRKLQERLQGNRDARSPVGMFSRGRNMYPGGNAANTGPNVQGAPDPASVNVQGAPDAQFQQQRQNALQQAMGQAGGPGGQGQAQDAIMRAMQAQRQNALGQAGQQNQQQDMFKALQAKQAMQNKGNQISDLAKANPAGENAARSDMKMREAARRKIVDMAARTKR